MNEYQSFIAKSRYAKWLEEKERREEWAETCRRYIDNVVEPRLLEGYKRAGGDLAALEDDLERLYDFIHDHEAMPSMRALMSAGAAFDRDNTAGYNCAYLPVNCLLAFDETLYILMCGTGVGFSVEMINVQMLPAVPEKLKERNNFWDRLMKRKFPKVIVQDSKEGWAWALREFLTHIFHYGVIPEWDTSLVRGAGERLKIFGGRASGPEPLEDLFRFIKTIVLEAKGRKLRPIEVHDIMCKIGEIVVVGGVRRSAMISLSDFWDTEMAEAKSGEWWVNHPHRALANNSAVFKSTPSREDFDTFWAALVASGSGERGIFNREASEKTVAKFGRREVRKNFGTNPCSEIILRPNQFCNLSEVVVRANDTISSLRRKVEAATILGTIQSSYTDFPYLSDKWKKNTDEERLLGVSLTGIMDCGLTNTNSPYLEDLLEELREVAQEANERVAKLLGIEPSKAITCVKPSGTVSQLTNSASGIHARHSPYFIRTVRSDIKDPMTQFMIDKGIPHEPCVMNPDSTMVFSFPMASPEGAVTRNDMTAIEQLEIWLTYQRHWCEHKPSVTISVREEEWAEVGDFVYEHFDEMSGVSFLPHSEHTYQQAPYQECDFYDYESLREEMPAVIDWSELASYEVEDTTKGSQTLACSGGACEIVDNT